MTLYLGESLVASSLLSGSNFSLVQFLAASYAKNDAPPSFIQRTPLLLAHPETSGIASDQKTAVCHRTFELISGHLQRLQLTWLLSMLQPRATIPFAHSLGLPATHIHPSA